MEPVSLAGTVRRRRLGRRPARRSLGGGGRQGVEPVQFGLQVARARVRRRVEQAVAGHDAVEAPASHPMIDVPVLRLGVDELGARPGRDQVPVGRLAAVTALVHEEDVGVGLEPRPDLAGVEVVADELAGVPVPGDASGPDQAADDEHVHRAVMAGGQAVDRPQDLAAVGRQAGHRGVAAGEHDDTVGQDQGRPERRRQGRRFRAAVSQVLLR